MNIILTMTIIHVCCDLAEQRRPEAAHGGPPRRQLHLPRLPGQLHTEGRLQKNDHGLYGFSFT